MLIEGRRTPRGFLIGPRADSLCSFGEFGYAHWGETPSVPGQSTAVSDGLQPHLADVLLVELRPPMRYMNRAPLGLAGVLDPEIHPSDEVQGEVTDELPPILLVFNLPEQLTRSDVVSGADWIGRGHDVDRETAQARLLGVATLIASLAEDRGEGEGIFDPYLCPSRLLFSGKSDVWVLGAAYDFDYQSSRFCIPDDVERYVHPDYAEERALAPRVFAPRDPAKRQSYMYYGFGRMVWETATGSLMPKGARIGEAELADLPPAWRDSQDLIRQCTSVRSWGPGEFLEMCRSVFAQAPAPSRYGEEEPSVDIPARPGLERIVPEERPPSHEERKGAPWWSVPVTFLVGAAVPLIVGAIFGINLLDPGETRRLRGDVKALRESVAQQRAEAKRWRLVVLLNEWGGASPARRKQIGDEIQQISPDNPNLRFMRLLAAYGAGGRAEDLLTEVAKLKQLELGGEGAEKELLFTKGGLDALEEQIRAGMGRAAGC